MSPHANINLTKILIVCISFYFRFLKTSAPISKSENILLFVKIPRPTLYTKCIIHVYPNDIYLKYSMREGLQCSHHLHTQ